MHAGELLMLMDRLNDIEKIITEEGFLKKKGIAGDVPFYVFDYLPEEELKVREHIAFLLPRLKSKLSDLKIIELKLFEIMLEQLKESEYLDKAFKIEVEKGSKNLYKALYATVKAERLIDFINKKNKLSDQDIILITGVGNIWPWVRTHSLLNNLQSVTGSASVIIFYPGVYNMQSFKLFDRLDSNSYYRAFRLGK